MTCKFLFGRILFNVGENSSGREIDKLIHAGDTGILTYKEREDTDEVYKKVILRLSGRRFISFEKDSEHGGIKVEQRELSMTED